MPIYLNFSQNTVWGINKKVFLLCRGAIRRLGLHQKQRIYDTPNGEFILQKQVGPYL